MSDQTALSLGHAAIKMQRARLVVEAWLRVEGEKGNLCSADQCPQWPDYQTALQAFYTELFDVKP